MNRLHSTVLWTIALVVSLCAAGSAVAAEAAPPTPNPFADSLPYIIGGAITLCILAVGFVLHLGNRGAESRPGIDAAPISPPSQESRDSTTSPEFDSQSQIVQAPKPWARLIVPGLVLGGIGVFVCLAVSLLDDFGKGMKGFDDIKPNPAFYQHVTSTPNITFTPVSYQPIPPPVINVPPYTPPPMPKPFIPPPPRPIVPRIGRIR